MLQNTILQGLKKAGIKNEINLSVPPNHEMGDFSFACFDIAKKDGTSPVECAKNIAGKIQKSKIQIIEKAVNAGPYVNLFVNASALAMFVLGEIHKKGKKYGASKIGVGKKIMIEYPSQNTHKEFHVGHLRNACIGNTLVNLLAKSGYNVQPVNYLNDFGYHIAKCLWGILNLHGGKLPAEGMQKWLGEVYAHATAHLDKNPEDKIAVDHIQKMLESRDKKIWKLFQKTRIASIKGFDKIHKELKIKHKHVFFETEVKNDGQRFVDLLLKKEIAKTGDGGAIIVDLSKFDLDIALIRKSNGAGVYMTSDLGLAHTKFAKENIQESINLTGSEQSFYFHQLFKILELSGFKQKMVHIGYGLVNLPSGKMSARAGNVILYEDLRNQLYSLLEKETRLRHNNWNESKIKKTALALAFASLKFSMLKHEAKKNIVFDMEEAMSFEGYSAPYILYSVARINSILKKAKKRIKKCDFSVLKEKEEKKLLLLLSGYDDVVAEATKQYNPSVITRYCFDLAKAFSDFYSKLSVLEAENSELISARLGLLRAVKAVLQDALNILSIDCVEEM
jgi:arginyl-tRNA synthetase